MLGDKDAVATIAVRDMAAARKFYEGTLGLKPVPGGGQERSAVSYKSGNSTVLVYQSQYAGTNKATTATWFVDDAEEMVQALKKKGVAFEQYDNLPGVTRKGDVHLAGKLKNAWFKDPDGNIIAVISQ